MTGAVGRSLAQSLKGIRVLDCSRVLAGPFAGQVLADLGAEVIKIEPPGGDETRAWGPPFAPGDGEASGLSAYFLSCNRGKESLVLDLKTPADRALLLRLAAKSDILLENWRTDSVEKLGLAARDLHEAAPQLIVCSLSGFGREGAHAKRAGYDFVMQGLAGLMAATGTPDGEPMKAGVAVVDVITGLYAVTAVLAALRARANSSHGYWIDLALLDCAAAAMVNVAQSFLVTGHAPARPGNAHSQIVPYELFRSKDAHLILAVGNDRQWRQFCAVAGREDLGNSPSYRTNSQRVRQRASLIPLVAAIIGERTTADWVGALTAAGVPAGPVWSVAQLLTSDLARERRLVIRTSRPDGSRVDLLRSPLWRPEEVANLSLVAPPRRDEQREAILARVLGDFEE